MHIFYNFSCSCAKWLLFNCASFAGNHLLIILQLSYTNIDKHCNWHSGKFWLNCMLISKGPGSMLACVEYALSLLFPHWKRFRYCNGRWMGRVLHSTPPFVPSVWEMTGGRAGYSTCSTPSSEPSVLENLIEI